MKIISTKLHAYIDYITGLALILFPFMFFISNNPAGSWILVGIGVLTLAVSLMTNYEGGMLALIPMPLHLMIDLLEALFLIASPWLFRFTSDNYLPHIIFGGFALLVTLLTNPNTKVSNNEKDVPTVTKT